MFYKGHAIKDTNLIFGKIKGQGLVSFWKLRDSHNHLMMKKTIQKIFLAQSKSYEMNIGI